MARAAELTSTQINNVSARYGLSPEETARLRSALAEARILPTEKAESGQDMSDGTTELPGPLIRLLHRYVKGGVIDYHQVERLAVLSGVDSGSAALRAALLSSGIEIRSQDVSSLPEEETGSDSANESPSSDHEAETAEDDEFPDEPPPDLTEVPASGQGVYAPSRTAEAVAAAREVLAEDRLQPAPGRRTLTALQEWGLSVLLRPGKPPGEVLPESYIRGLPHDGEAYRAWTALVLHNVPLVWSVVKRYGDRRDDGLEREDLDHHGVLGLMTAIRKFDVTRGYKFSTYAVWWIRQSVERGIANESGIIRHPVHFQETIRKIRRAEDKLREEGRTPSRENLRLRTGLPARAVNDYFRIRRHVDYLDRPAGDVTLGELVPDERTSVPGPEEALSGKFGLQRVDGILSLLRPREAQILRLRHGVVDGERWTLEQIGSVLGVTRERVRQLESRALKAIRTWASEIPGPDGHSPGSIVDEVIKRNQAATRPSVTWVLAGPERARGEVLRQRARLLTELRASGYNLTTALADLVDNGIAAGARTVRIEYSPVPGREWVAICDDGRGMNEDELRRALRLSPDPDRRSDPAAGRTLGPCLSAASLSQARRLTVFSRRPGGQVATQTWDVDEVRADGRWFARRDADPVALDILDHLQLTEHGTVVIWRRADGLGRSHQIGPRIEQAARDLGLLFHRYLEQGEVKILVGGSAPTPIDPLQLRHPATQNRGTEDLVDHGHRVRVNPVVLPHPSRIGYGGQVPGHQGFHVYRGLRLVVAGSWLGLPGLHETDEAELARVCVELPPEAAVDWRLDVRTPAAQPPVPVVERLTRLAEDVRERSARVLARSRRPKTDEPT